MNSDETRFLAMLDDTDESERSTQSSGLAAANIVFNWFTELNEKVPVE